MSNMYLIIYNMFQKTKKNVTLGEIWTEVSRSATPKTPAVMCHTSLFQ